MLVFWFGYWDEWNLYHKVTFDGENKLILVNFGETNIDVDQDIYSDWKEWWRVRDNAKFQQVVRSIGGDPTTSGSFAGATYFLTNGWKIRTWEGNHTLNVDGNLFTDSGEDPFVNTIDAHNILVRQTVSNIVDKVVLSGSGGLTDDDRTTIGNIETIVTQIKSDVSTVVSSSFIAAASVLAGSTTTQIKTTLTQYDNKFKGMQAIIKNSNGGEARHIDFYTQSNGTLYVYPPLSFTPQSGDSVVIVPMFSTEYR